MKKILCWHFSAPTLGHDAGDLSVAAGYIYSIEPDRTPELCRYGMHGSRRLIHALEYAPLNTSLLSLCHIYGDVTEGQDKLVGRHRHVLACADVTMLLHRAACRFVRETPIGDGKTAWDLLTDPRSRAAIETKDRWIRGEVSDVELAAAWAAASAASWAAASAASSAAASAAADAASAASWAAASAASWAATSATSAASAANAAASAANAAADVWAANAGQNTILTEMVLELSEFRPWRKVVRS